MKRLILLLALALPLAAQYTPPGGGGGASVPPSGLFSALPAASGNVRAFTVTDCLASACATGGGALTVLLVSNGTTWSPSGSGSGVIAYPCTTTASAPTCTIVHGLNTTTPNIGNVIVAAGGGSAFKVSNFTANTFDLTDYAPSTLSIPVSAPIAPTAGFYLSIANTAGTAFFRSGVVLPWTINILETGGYSSTATPSCSGLPTGVTASFSPTTVTGAGSTALTLAASATATAGAGSCALSVTDGTITRTSSLAFTVLTPNPVQQWLLNEGTGTSHPDSSGNANTVTSANTTYTTVAGFPFQALTFNGSTSTAQSANHTAFNPVAAQAMSASMWATFASTSSDLLVSQFNAFTNGWTVFRNQNGSFGNGGLQIIVNVVGTTGQFLAGYTPTIGITTVPQHICYTDDGTHTQAGIALYLNGLPMSAGHLFANSFSGTLTPNQNIFIGSGNATITGAVGTHNGAEADVRIFASNIGFQGCLALYQGGPQ